jgi:hypothetical protein
MKYYGMKWRITHGEPELADDWLLRVAIDLKQDKELSDEDTNTLANILFTAGYHKEGARLFNDMKLPDKRRKVTDKMRLYFAVEGYRDKGMTKTLAIPLAAEDCDYLKGCRTEIDKDEPLRRAGNDYIEAQKQFHKFMLETMRKLKAYPPPPKAGG